MEGVGGRGIRLFRKAIVIQTDMLQGVDLISECDHFFRFLWFIIPR